MKVKDLIKELSKIEDKELEVEVPVNCTEADYDVIRWVEVYDWGVKLVN